MCVVRVLYQPRVLGFHRRLQFPSFFCRQRVSREVMKVFTQKFNPLSGQNEWVVQEENYDYYQEVARSAYADMLHDKERNQLYYEAIKRAVASVKQKGKKAKVLDIGTGTGLLSMMAVCSGADSVIACEAFKPVAECALKVIKDNGLHDKIEVIPKRSTELTVGPGGDMPEKANILIAEVFDTELIGEGALSTFHHALNTLLEADSIVVPSEATVYAQVVQSTLISNFNTLSPLSVDDQVLVAPPPEVRDCQGTSAVHDIQMSQLPPDCFQFVSDPVSIFRFDFSGKIPLQFKNQSQVTLSALRSGSCDVVFMWWDLKMDCAGDVILSCAPPWAHRDPKNMAWRDHWMQAIYYLPKRMFVTAGEIFQLCAYHDEFSLWFSTAKCPSENTEWLPPPVCQCLMHCTNSRSRIGMLNDYTRNVKLVEVLKKVVTPSSVCLCVGSNSILPVLAARMGAKYVFCIESSYHHSRILESYSVHNAVGHTVKVINKPYENVVLSDLHNEKVDILLSEPYFTTNLLPWDAVYFWRLKSMLKPLLKDSAHVVPQSATVKSVAVEFEHLWKIRSPVVEAEGFCLSAFDKMVQEAISVSDASTEPHPLWEYRCKPLSNAFELITFDESSPTGKDVESSGAVNFISEGLCNGVAVWVDFQTDNVTVTTGPTETLCPGREITWDMYTRQGVYFIQPAISVKPSGSQVLKYRVNCNLQAGQLDFSFWVCASN